VTPGPGSNRTEPPVASQDHPRRPLPGRLVGLSVTIVALVGLITGAVHGSRATAAQASRQEVAQARLDIAYYDCLTRQVANIIGPNQRVVVSTANPGAWATLSKVVAPRDVMTTEEKSAVGILSLKPDLDGCLGSVVVVRYRDGTGAQARGPTLRADEGPPSSPL